MKSDNCGFQAVMTKAIIFIDQKGDRNEENHSKVLYKFCPFN